MKVLFAGGGTGGHVYPALAVAQLLTERDSNTEVLFVGTQKGWNMIWYRRPDLS